MGRGGRFLKETGMWVRPEYKAQAETADKRLEEVKGLLQGIRDLEDGGDVQAYTYPKLKRLCARVESVFRVFPT